MFDSSSSSSSSSSVYISLARASAREANPVAQDVCRDGQWSFTARPLLHVSHTWVLERNALLGCEWRLLNSRKFASPLDQDVVWTLSLEIDYPHDAHELQPYNLRAPDMVRVCASFNTEVPHKRVYFRGVLRAQQEAHGALPATASSSASSNLSDAAKYAPCTQSNAPVRGVLEDMTLAHPIQREHIGDVYIVASDRSLTIRVDITYLADVEEPQAGPPSVSLNVPPCSLLNDLEALLVHGAGMSDVVLVAEADGKEWRAHKAILAARSPVFAAMFKHNMAEKQNNLVTIGDVSGDVFDQVLRYLYTGRAEHIRTLGVDVLAVADRYALPRLKAMCEEELAASVTVETALEVLVTADLHNAKVLRETALQCVCSNVHLLMDSEDWRAVTRAHPHILPLVLAKCINLPRPD